MGFTMLANKEYNMTTRVISSANNNTAAAAQNSSITNGSGDFVNGTVIDSSGNLVVFTSLADLTGSDDNGVRDVYLYRSGTLTNLTHRKFNGTPTTGVSDQASISSDGQRIALASFDRNLSSVTGNNVKNIYLVTNLTSTAPAFQLVTTGFTNDSFNPSISADGNWVVFETKEPQGGFDGTDSDIVLYDRVGGANLWVSQITRGGGNIAASSINASVSGDGRYVVFQSDGNESQFIPSVVGDNGVSDIFLFDRNDRSLRLVSRAESNPNTAANGNSRRPKISSDGRYVVYDSAASNLILGDSNAARDVFSYEIATGVNTRISLRPGGSQTNRDSFSPTISANGGAVSFDSFDEQLISGDNNGTSDVFVWQRSTGAISLVSADSTRNIGNALSENSSISPDGNKVVFESIANDLAQPVQAGIRNIFLNDELTGDPPTTPPTGDPLTAPVYRFYNAQSRGHFFTTSTAERDTVLANQQWGYTAEGVGFRSSTSPGANLLPVYRFYNPISKGHFFTTDEAEKNNVLANPQWQYTFEGVGFYTYGASASLGSDVYRFYNPISRGHFFTISDAEKNNVLANPQWQYTFEGVGFEAKM
jgi:hypothetical protein